VTVETTRAVDTARAVADAVLYEGYLLYPYRASSSKNQVRWQFGILGPPGALAAGVGEEPTMQTECLLELRPGGDARVDLHLRFLQVQSRTVERAVGDTFAPVEELRVGPASWISWHEAVEQEISIEDVVLADLVERTFPVDVPGGDDVELLRDVDGTGPVVGRLVRRRAALTGVLHLAASPVDGPYPLLTLRARLENRTGWSAEAGAGSADSPRDVAARYSFVGTHLLLAVRGGAFLSLTDPPEWAVGAAAACTNSRCWPVLVGPDERRDVVLASPIILPDHPEVAPESPGALYDSTEIDEILTLRIMTLTDDEKVAARGTDARAAAIIDRCDTMPPEIFERLHGALRTFDAPASAVPPVDPVPWWDPGVDASVSPESDAVQIGDTAVAKGSRVMLRPKRRADAQDLFLADQRAIVTGVFVDVDGGTHVAVVLEDDPASELHDWYGRYYYFGPEEIEPLPAQDGGRP